MAIAILFDGSNRVTTYNVNADTLDYLGRPDALVYYDGNSDDSKRETVLNLLRSVQIKYLKVVAGELLEMTQEEKSAIDSAEALASLNSFRSTALSLVDLKDPQAAIIRSALIEILNYCNAERNKFNTLLAWLGTQGTLSNRTQLNAMSLIEATVQQAKDSIKNRINNGEAD